MNVALWIAQGLLAALFLFAGVSKLVLPLEAMKGPVDIPGWFLRSLGVVETLGGLGMILPGLLRIRPGLTPLAAAGLVLIMIGATALHVKIGDYTGALTPLVALLLAVFVAYGRSRLAPLFRTLPGPVAPARRLTLAFGDGGRPLKAPTSETESSPSAGYPVATAPSAASPGMSGGGAGGGQR